jgi:glucokinase
LAAVTAFLGIDVGATKVAAGMVDVGSGAVLRRTSVPSDPARGGTPLLADCVALAQRVVGRDRVAGVGIGVCELVDPHGAVHGADSFDWRGLDIAASFRKIAPIRVESDVRAAARAEAVFGAGRTLRSFLYVNAGTGISSALMLDGQPYIGARGNAVLLGAGPLHAERVSGGTAIARAAGMASAADVSRAAAGGDEQAGAVLARAGAALGEAIAFAVNLLDPEAVVLGGSVVLGAAPYRQALEPVIREHLWAEDTRELPLLTSELGDSAGLIGAALAGAQGNGRGA